MKPQRTISSYILLVGIMGLSIMGGVVAYQIYSAAVKSQVTVEQSAAIKPIDGQIDTAIIESLRNRTVINESEMQQLLTEVPEPEPVVATVSSAVEATASTTIEP